MYFKKKFLCKEYYEERAKEFYELKLGSMTMKDLNSKFLSLLRYVPYLVDENLKCNGFSAVCHITSRTESSIITRRIWRKPCGRLISVLNRTRRKKV